MFVVGEVPDGGCNDIPGYTGIGRVTNFDYGNKVADAVKRGNNFKYFGNFGPSWFGGLGINISRIFFRKLTICIVYF